MLMVLFVPGLGDATTPRWALLSVGVWAFVLWQRATGEFSWRPALLLLPLLGWAAVSLLWTPNLYDGIDALWKLTLLAGIVMIGFELRDTEPLWIGAALGIGINSTVAIGQWSGIDLVPRIDGAPGMAAGLFMNKNYLGEAAALVLIGLAAKRMWLWIPMVLPAVVLPQCKGALVAVGICAVVALWPRRKGLALVLFGTMAWAAILFAGTDFGSDGRIVLWAAALDGLHPVGNGVGSFYSLFPGHAPGWDFLQSRPVHAHNDWLEIAYDLGIPGAMLVAAMLAGTLRMGGPWRFVVIGFIVEACFGFPLHFPATLLLFGVACGHLVRDWAELRQPVAVGGEGLREGVGCHLCSEGPCGYCGDRCAPLSARSAPAHG